MSAADLWVAVIGPGVASGGEERVAEEIGARLAAANAVLVCGGLGGVMAAACRGAESRGGVTVGLLPGVARADANPWVQIAVPTGLGEARNALVVRSAEAVIAVGGGWGTLSEIALALRAGLTVVGLDTWQPERQELPQRVLPVGDAETAVAVALEHARVRRARAGAGAADEVE
jgi:hypothetical protein